MSSISKQALLVENNTSFPDNNTGYITPSALRAYNVDVIDSTVNQATYSVDLAAVQADIAALEAFTASQQPSFTALNQFTASQSNINSGVNTFTQSAADRLGDLEQATASIEAFTASINEIKDEGTTLGYSTRFNFRGDLISASITANVNGPITNVDVVSDSTKTNLTTFNAYTASNDARFNSYTQSTDQRIGSLENATGSYVALGADNVFTGTTNTFNNNVNILGTLTATSASFQYTTSSVVVVGQNKILLNTDTPSVRFGGISVQDSGSVGNPSGSLFWDSQNNVWIYQHPSGSGEGYNTAILIAGPANSGSIGNEQTLTAGKIPVATGEDHISDSILTQTAAGITAAGNINATGDITASGNISATGTISSSGNILTSGYVSASAGFYSGPNTTALNIGDGSNVRFWSGSTGGSEYYNIQLVPGVGDIAFSRSGAGNVKTFTLAGVAGNKTTFQNNAVEFQSTVDSVTLNASSSVRGTFEISGQSSGDGKAILLGHSGSLVVGNSTTNTYYAALAHLSSSAANANTNLIFKNSTATADTIISGSANIFANPVAPTSGFKRYIGTSNIFTHGNSVPQISGSMAFSPSINGNILSHTQTNAFTFRGPISSSTATINHNIMMGSSMTLGTSAANNFEKAAAGVNVLGNAMFSGVINAVANTTTLTNAPVVSGNLVFGALVNLNMYSSSIQYASNVQNGGITINNSYSPTAGTAASALSFRATTNTIYGTGHVVNVDGTNTSTTIGKAFNFNILAGTYLTASVPTGDNSAILATGLIGNGLVITGSTLPSTFAGPDLSNNGQGSLFAGRYNALDGTKAKTAESIFAVGTGTSYTNRKTGFLIDSGSNTFVEGSLNVSGSFSINGGATPLALTGSTIVTGSLTITGSTYGNVLPVTVSAGTASLDFNKANYFTLTLPSSSVTNINVFNYKPGQTAILLTIPDGTAASASFNQFTKQPAGFAYSGSSGGYDVLTFTSFTTNDVFLTSVTQLQ